MPGQYFRNVTFKGAYPDIDKCPSSAAIPLVAFTGRSNSGKSSLLSALCDHKNLAKTSSTAGKTRTLNYFLVPPGEIKGPGLYLVDMPGFGFANVTKEEATALRTMADRFFLEAENIKLIIVVSDARRDAGQEEMNLLKFAKSENIPIVFARTKWDTMNAKEKSAAKRSWKELGIESECLPVSSPKKIGLDELIDLIRSL